MRKVLLLFLLMLAIGLGYEAAKILPSGKAVVLKPKQVVLKVALVTDSHNDNDLLAKALAQAKAEHVDFVIGMGDFTNTGTVAELEAAKSVFNTAGLTYYVTAGDHDLWDSRDKELKAEAGEASLSALDNFRQVFGQTQHVFREKGIQFVIVDNSDIYKGIDTLGRQLVESVTASVAKQSFNEIASFPALRGPRNDNLVFVFAHKTPYHPQSAHIMGEQTPAVAEQAKEFMGLLEQPTKPCHSGDPALRGTPESQFDKDSGQARMTGGLCPAVDGFFSGDLHFFAKFSSPSGSVRMTTIGAVTRESNPQGPRFGVLTIYEDYSWEVADVEIR